MTTPSEDAPRSPAEIEADNDRVRRHCRGIDGALREIERDHIKQTCRPIPFIVTRFDNGMVMTFDEWGEQIAELQGHWSSALENRIRERNDEVIIDNTVWPGFIE